MMAIDLAQACSFLFVPATRPERLPKALASGADAVIADWEDAVAPDDKALARTALDQALAGMPAADRARVLVRINAEGTLWHTDDLRALAPLMAKGMAGVVVPKAERAQTLHAAAQAAGPEAALLPLVESVAGLAAADALAAAPQVVRLLFGHLDFQADAGMACGAGEEELLPMRMALVLASRRAGKSAPVDGVTVDTRDAERMAADTERAKRMGFGGKLCIHPAQVAVLHRVFDPGAQEVAQAQRIVQAMRESDGGVCTLDGRMVDAPVLKQARQILARHARALARARPGAANAGTLAGSLPLVST